MASTTTGGPEPLMLAMREHGREKILVNGDDLDDDFGDIHVDSVIGNEGIWT